MPIFINLIPVILGGIAGLATNYLADVLPITRSFSLPVCRTCETPFRMVDYLLMRPCRACGTGPYWRRWAVLAVYLIASLATWIHPAHRMGYYVGLALLVYLGVVVVIDLEYRVVLTQVSLAGVLIGGAIGLWTRGFVPTFLGGAAGFGIMLILYFLGGLYARWINRRSPEPSDEVALGFGDVNLNGILGLVLGWPVIVVGLLTGIVAGGVVSLVYILILAALRKYKLFTAIPYAPFLVFGAIVFLYGF